MCVRACRHASVTVCIYVCACMFLFVTGVWVVRPCVIVWEGEVGMLHLKLEIQNFQKCFLLRWESMKITYAL